jgi:hypothetical protein
MTADKRKQAGEFARLGLVLILAQREQRGNSSNLVVAWSFEPAHAGCHGPVLK